MSYLTQYSMSVSNAADLRRKLAALAVLGGIVKQMMPRGTWEDQQGEFIFFSSGGYSFTRIGQTWFTVDRIGNDRDVKCRPTEDGTISIYAELP